MATYPLIIPITSSYLKPCSLQNLGTIHINDDQHYFCAKKAKKKKKLFVSSETFKTRDVTEQYSLPQWLIKIFNSCIQM